MIYRIEVSEQAELDIRCIFEYIAFELNAPRNAERQFARIEKAVLSLEELPERHRQYKSKVWQGLKLRFIPVDNYCIFYVIDKINSKVIIIRIMYGGRDFSKTFS